MLQFFRITNNMMTAKVSIVTVTYNCESTIEETLLSVIRQTYNNTEIIVIDGRSSDNTINIINKYKEQIDVFVSEKDHGIFDAMNKGIQKATGDWIMFMNAGDSFFESDTISQLSYLMNDPSNGVIYGPHFLRYNNHNRLINDIPFFQQNGKYRNMGFSHQSCLVRTKLAKKYYFELEYKLSADYKMLWHLYYDENVCFAKSDIPIAIMDDNGGETVSNYKRHLVEECEICGFWDSQLRSFFIELKFFEFKIKRLIKKLIFMR